MARTPFPVEVLTPEGLVFGGEVEMLSTRTEVGEIGVLGEPCAPSGDAQGPTPSCGSTRARTT